MPSVTITLTDTPTGGVAVQSNYVPALGQKTSLAQSAAQDIINRTCREYGLPNPTRSVAPVLRDGIDIDAVHRSRDNVVENMAPVVAALKGLTIGEERGR
jgi:hypothetical protein